MSPRVDVLTPAGSWDTPPRLGELGFQSFRNAFGRFLESRKVRIRRRNKYDVEFDDRKKGVSGFKIKGTPSLGQSSDLKLMPFQVCALPFVLKTLKAECFTRLTG